MAMWKNRSFTAHYVTLPGQGKENNSFAHNIREDTPAKVIDAVQKKCPEGMYPYELTLQAGGLGTRLAWKAQKGKKPEDCWYADQLPHAFES